MAITLVANTGAAGDGNVVTTAAIDTTGASLLVACCGTTTSLALTDSKSNTWTALTERTGDFGGKLRMYYVASPTVGTNHTVTISGVGETPVVCWAAFAGVHATPFDQESGANVDTSTPTAPGSLTPAQNDSLLVACGGVYVTSGFTIDGGFTVTNTVYGAPAQNWGMGAAYLIQTTAAAANPSIGWTNPNGIACGMGVFLAAAAGGGKVRLRQRPLMGMGA